MLSRLRARTAKEAGFVLVLLSLVMTGLILMVGFAVDVGAWYLRATQMQRAADAAALAGSIDMPDSTLAANNAIASAEQNGFINGTNISVRTNADASGKLTVTITDKKVPTFFASLVFPNISITRVSSAKRLSPVPMGTPFNILGGELGGDFEEQNFMLAINGSCTPKEDGDLYSSARDGNRVFNAAGDKWSTTCNGGEVNSDYRPEGYNYIVTVPASTPGGYEVSIYDAGFWPERWDDPDWVATWPHDALPPVLNTTYSLYDTKNTDSHDDDTLMATKTFGYHDPNPAASQDWITLGQMPRNSASVPHKYRVNVRVANNDRSIGVNTFSIVADRLWTWENCDGRKTPTCAQVAGEGAMSVMTTSHDENGAVDFYLAQVDESYAGYLMTVTLWDPGEGFKDLRLISPDGRIVPVRWHTEPALDDPPPSGAVYSVDVSGWGSQPGPNRGGDGLMNDRRLIMQAKIPLDYQSYIDRAGGSTWWKVEYRSEPDAWLHDRTTWLVSIGGAEPVHLVTTDG